MHDPTLHQHRGEPSDWITRWAGLVPAGTPVLDIACGSGRHLEWFARRGHPVCGVDRDVSSARDLTAGFPPESLELIQADLENAPWPLKVAGTHRTFGLIVVTNYLWRPLYPDILASLAPGGVLLYETFASGNETVGRPARPDFLLNNGELLHMCATLNIIAYENGFKTSPERFVQRIAASRPLSSGTPPGLPSRYPL